MKPRRNLFLGSLLVIALSQAASALTYYWDTSTAAGHLGGNGTWDTSGAAFWGDLAGTATLASWTNGSDAVFDASTASILTFGANNITAGTLQFNNSNFTIRQNSGTSRSFTFTTLESNATTGTQTVTFDIPQYRSINLGTGTIQDGSTGGKIAITLTAYDTERTLFIGGNNTYTGGTTISGGVIELRSTGALGSSGTISMDGGALRFHASNTTDYSSRLKIEDGKIAIFDTNGQDVNFASSLALGTSATGGIRKIGTGTLTLSAVTSYSGNTAIDAGTLDLKSTAANGTYTTASGATLTLSTGSVINTNTTTFKGAGTLKITNGVTFGSGSKVTTVEMAAGGLVWVTNNVTVTGSSSTNGEWDTNQASLQVDAGSTINFVEMGDSGTTKVDALTGGGTVRGGYNGTKTLYVGVANGSGTFSGALKNRQDDATHILALRKEGSGTQILSGTNTYTGPTNVTAGVLQFAKTASLYNSATGSWTSTNLLASSGATMAFNVGGTGEFTSANIDTIKGSTGIVSGSAIGLDTTNAGGNFTYSGGVFGTGVGLTKYGTGTLNYGAANTGPVTIDNGTLNLTADSTGVKELKFGATAGSANYSALDLSTNNLTATGLTVQNNNATANSITIGSGKTLTINGNVALGNYNATATSKLNATGLGTLTANIGTGTFYIGTQGDVANTIDFSGLSNFNLNSTSNASILRLGVYNIGSRSSGANTLTLAANSILNVGTIDLGKYSYTADVQTLNLNATGTNTIYAATLNIGTGENPSGGGRGQGQLKFAGAGAGTLTLAGYGGTGGVNVNMSTGNTASGTGTSYFDVTGHSANITIATLNMSNAGDVTNHFKFDTGTLNITTANVGQGNNANSSATLQIGSTSASTGMATIGSLVLADNKSAGTLNVLGGTLTMGGAITEGATTPGASTVKLSGGTLDMGGFAIGTLASPINTLTFESGTLKNVASINGTAGITKTTAGTLILEGNNTYTGVTAINDGVINIRSNSALGSTAGNTTIASGKKLQIQGVGLLIPENFTVTGGTIENVSGANTLQGTITKASAVTLLSTAGTLTIQGGIDGTVNTVNLQGAGDGEISGVISSAYTIAKTGAGTWTLSGASANTYTPTNTPTVSEGTLLLAKSAGQAIAGGGLTIGGANNTAATVRYTGASSDMMGTGTVTINGRGILDFNGKTDTIGNVSIVSTGATTSNPTPITNTAGGGNLTIGTLGITPVAGFTSVVNSGTGTLTLGGNVTFTAATTGRAQVSGNLDLGSASRTLAVALGTGADYDLLVDAAVSSSAGAYGITKDGAGRLRLAGTNTFTGNIAINEGTLSLVSGLSLSSTPILNLGATSGTAAATIHWVNNSLTTNNALVVRSGSAGTKSVLVNSSVSGTVASLELNDNLTKGSSGTLIVSGGTTLNGGGSRTIDVNSGTLTLTGAVGESGGTGNLVKTGTGTLNLTAARGYTGTTTVNGGTLNLGSGWNTASVNSLISGLTGTSGTLGIDTGDGNIAQTAAWDLGALALTKSGSNTLTLDQANSFTGNVTVTGGILRASDSGAFGTGTKIVNVSNSGSTTGTLELNGNMTFSNAISFSLSNNSSVGNGINSSGTTQILGGVSIASSNGLIASNSGSLTISGEINTSANTRTIWLGGSSILDNTASGLISGAGSIGKTGPGKWVITRMDNTYDGATTIRDGILSISKIANYGAVSSIGDAASGNIQLGNGSTTGTLVYTGSGDTSNRTFQIGNNSGTPAAGDTGGGSIINNGSGALTFDATTFNTAQTGVIASTARVFTLGGSNLGDNKISGQIQNNTVGVSGTGAVAVTKQDAGKWILSGANTYTGNTTITGGTLQLGAEGVIPNGSGKGNVDISAAGTLDMNLLSETIGGLSGAGTVDNVATAAGATTLTVGDNNQNTTFSGVIKNTGGDLRLTKIGSGTLTLSGANTYRGGTTITNGTLKLSHTGDNEPAIKGNVTLSTSTNGIRPILYFGADNQLEPTATISATIGGSNSVYTDLVLAGSSQTIAGYATSGSPSSGTSFIENGYFTGDAGAGVLTINNSSTVTLGGGTGSNRLSIRDNNGTGGGTLGLVKDGVGTLVFNLNSATYTGGFTMKNGTTQVAGIAFGASTPLKLEGGALSSGDGTARSFVSGNTVSFDGNITLGDTTNNGKLTFAGAGTLTGNRQLTIASDVEFSGTIGETGGARNLTKTGDGTLTLSGTTANTYTGLTTVSAGTLELNKSADVNAVGGNLTVSGGTLKWLANEQMSDATTTGLVLNSGTVDLNGKIETLGTFTNYDGTFSTGVNGQLIGTGETVTWAGGTNTINSGGLVKDKHVVITGGTNTVQAGGRLELQTGGGTSGLIFGGTSSPTIMLDSVASGTAGRILLEQNVTVDATLISGTAQILNGGSAANSGFINLQGGTRTFTVNNGSAATDMLVSAVITNGGLTKDGAGTLALSGANTYTDATTITGGTLQLGNGGTTGSLSTSSAITNNGTLAFNRSNTITQGTDFGTITSGTGAVVQNGSGTVVLNAANTYTGATAVNAGVLVIGSGGSLANTAVTVGGVAASGAPTLAGVGTIGGNTVISSASGGAAGKHSPGLAGVGTQTFSGNLTYGSGSIFEWDLNANSTSSGYDKVSGGGTLTVDSGAIFKIVLGSGVTADPFWTNPDVPRTWSDIFSGFTSLVGSFSTSNIELSGPGVANIGMGSFSISGTTLTWTAVPEPTSALVGLLIGAGLLRRNRKQR